MNARILLSNKEQRQQFLETVDIDRNELLVETVDRFAHDHAVLMNPTCPDALVAAKQMPEVVDRDGKAYTVVRHMYIARDAQAVKILMSQSGTYDVSPSRCLVLRQAA